MKKFIILGLFTFAMMATSLFIQPNNNFKGVSLSQLITAVKANPEGGSGHGYGLLDCKWKARVVEIGHDGKPTGKVHFETHTCSNCAYNCNGSAGSCTEPKLCPQGN